MKKLLKQDTNISILLVLLITMSVLLAAVLGGRFYSANNFQSMAYQVSEFGFLAIAMSMAMISGGIDLSIVANAGLAGVMGALITSGRMIPVTEENHMMIIIISIGVIFIFSTLGGLINGVLIAKFSVPPILATLGTMILYNGIGMAITNGESIGIVVLEYSAIGIKTVFGIPVIFVLLVIIFGIVMFIMGKTKFGKEMCLIGENKVALMFSGEDTEKALIKNYMLIGVLVGFAAMIMTAKVNSAKMGFGDTYQLQAILVAVLAGFNPEGGKGKIIGVALAIISLQFLQSAFTILNFTPYFKKFIWGAVLLLAMIINYYINKEKRVRINQKTVTPAGSN